MDENLIDLINRDVDGETSREESVKLKRILEENAEAREMQNEIRRVVKKVESIPVVDPPADMRQQILDSVRGSRSASPAAPVVKGAFGRRTGIRYAWAIAAGVLFGFILHPLVVGSPGDRPSIDSRQAVGTIGAAPSVVTSEAQSVSTTGGEAAFALSTRASDIIIDVALNTSGSVGLTFDSSGFALKTLSPKTGNPRVSIDDGRIAIAGEAGSRLQMLFSRSGMAPGTAVLRPSGSDGSSIELIHQP